MKIKTTCIGAYPKPDYITLPDWFNLQASDTSQPTVEWQKALDELGGATDGDSDDDTGNAGKLLIERGVAEVVKDQVDAGIDIPTDGEIIRENYVHYQCRHFSGFDFKHLTEKTLRDGAYVTALPTVTSKVFSRSPFLHADWKLAQRCTDRPVKMTLPGPLTVTDTTADNFYHNDQRLGADIADALNADILKLASDGCIHIQIDEPLFARHPDRALDYGFENIERAFHRCPRSVTRTVHMCCGYPDKLDNKDYPKADPGAYNQLTDAVEYSKINAVSLEDAHRHNNLELLERFQNTSVILGVVAIANTEVETVEQIRHRLNTALQHIDADRLMAAPDCGLGMLPRELAIAKLTNLCLAAADI